LNIDFGITNERQVCKIGTVGALVRQRRMNMADGLHVHIQNRTIKPLAIALSGEGRGFWCVWRRMEGVI
jgi:hypothetical protein